MAIVCDFIVIQGDSSHRIGDGATLWEKTFLTESRLRTRTAFLMFMVKGLTVTEKEVDVKINNTSVGKISPYTGANKDHWFTQIIHIGSEILNDGENELQLEAVDYEGGGSDHFDDFYLRDIICFFKQSA
jgi:hypothetical protein